LDIIAIMGLNSYVYYRAENIIDKGNCIFFLLVCHDDDCVNLLCTYPYTYRHKFEDTKEVIRSRKSKTDLKYNGKKKEKDLQNTT